jgi:gluconate kinase
MKDEMFRSLIVPQPPFGISYAVSAIKVTYRTVLRSSCKVLSFLFNFNQNRNVSILEEFQNIKYHKNPLVKTQQWLPPAR